MLFLKFVRLARGLRQQQIATLMDVPRPHISQFENGVRNPTPQQLAALERIFNCAGEGLLQHVGAEFVPPHKIDREVRRG